MESEFGLEIGDDEWWKKAEQRVLREARRAKRRARTKAVARWLPLVLVVAVVGAGGVWAVRHDRLPSVPALADSADDAAEVVSPALTERQLREPFVGTPAAALLIEADGIVLPEARPVGRHSAADVAARLRTVRELIVLSRFDSRMVLRRDPSALLTRLAPAQRTWVAGLFNTDDGHAFGTRLASGSTLLAPTRVHGAMTARIGRNGELVVATDYAFTYALEPARKVLDRAETHVIVRAQVVYGFLADRRFTNAEQGIHVEVTGGYSFNVNCDQYVRGLVSLPKPTESSSEDGLSEAARKRLYRADVPMPEDTADCPGSTPAAPQTPTATGRPV